MFKSMKRVASILCCIVLMVAVAACGQTAQPAQTSTQTPSGNTESAKPTATPEATPEPVTINFATAGDTNMTEFFNNQIVPAFTAEYPHITVNVVGTGPGDSGSKNIHTKWKAQLDAGKDKWDLDAACVNQSVMRDLIADGLITKYVPETENAKYVTTPSSKNCLGTPVTDYVIPMFQSQTVLAYNPAMVPTPPKTFDELEAWIKANPKKFGYNGVKGGMSGVAFTAAYLYNKTGEYDLYSKGPYDVVNTEKWKDVLKELKALPVVYTQGNAGTLDMLNRGEIAIGPVWVDMLLLWKSEGRMDSSIKMLLPEPGMPGQPMYLVVADKATNYEAAKTFCDFIARPDIQAKYVVEAYTWHPGVDSVAVFEKCSQAAKDKLFSEVSADEISKKGLSLPLANYMKDMLTIYEEVR